MTEERIFNLTFPINEWAEYNDGLVSVWITCDYPAHALPFRIETEEYDLESGEMVTRDYGFVSRADAEYWLYSMSPMSQWTRSN